MARSKDVFIPPDAAKDLWVTIPEAAKFLDVHVDTVYRWIRERVILKKWIAYRPSGRMMVNVYGLLEPTKTKRKKHAK